MPVLAAAEDLSAAFPGFAPRLRWLRFNPAPYLIAPADEYAGALAHPKFARKAPRGHAHNPVAR